MIIIVKEKLGITLSSLLAANPQVKNRDLINVGDVLNVPLCGKNGTAAATATTFSKASKATKGKLRLMASLE